MSAADRDRRNDRAVTLGFVAVGVIAAAAAAAVPANRSVLIALAGTAWLGALLTRLVVRTPGHPALVAESVHAAHASTIDRLAMELDLAGPAVYVPTGTDVRLYVARTDGPLPDDVSDALVTDAGARGLSVAPVGAALLARLDDPRSAESTDERIRRLTEAIVDRFELAGGIDVDRDGECVTVTVTDASIEDLGRRDHPIGSVLAVGLAEHLDRPVRVRVEGDRVICSWDRPVDSNTDSS
ncbi:hypothetical protein [Halococcoides cellulosivorans]|uniref:DUF7982 domain-containing protein n=1 Tax=Halococcoides cellulosivorans TaxID=1679096 RepID=A0A2R4X4C9_9EURY|nr:hypothetical protein [Halococcoides cellulosivorans]AWB28553.1 hypothetical protein HARCEL1_13115 [Halococcoides cellulosivorans]